MPEATLKRKLLVWAGYTVFFVGAFVFFCYWTFPYERLRDYLVAQVSAGQGGSRGGEGGWQLSIGELGPHWLTGVSLEQVELKKAAEKRGGAETQIKLDEATLSISPVALLLGDRHIAFDGELGDGSFEGEYEIEGSNGPTRVLAEFDALDVGALGVAGFLGVPVKGELSGEIDLTVAKDPAQTEGMVDLRIEELSIGDGKAKLPLPGMGSGLTLDTVRAGTFELQLNVKEGIAALDKLETKGEDLELSGSGSLRILQPLGRSRPDITLAIKVDDAYKSKSPRTKAAFELMGNNPVVKRATAPDGALRFKLIGDLERMRMNPAGPASAARSRGAPRPPRPGDEDD